MNFEKLVDQATEMALHNSWGENAYKINMAILKIDKKNTASCTRLAKYYKLNDNIDEAKNMYLKALDIDPNNRVAINNLNDIAMDQRECEEVEKIKTAGALFKEGKKVALKGKLTLADKLLSKAYSMEPVVAHAVSLAGVYKKMGKFDCVEKLYRELLENNHKPGEIETINNEFKTLRVNLKTLI